jgi:hypothetical protein
MKATKLEGELARLAPGETLLLPTDAIERTFRFCSSRQARREAAANLAWWYACSLAFCGPKQGQVLFTRHDDRDDSEITNYV